MLLCGGRRYGGAVLIDLLDHLAFALPFAVAHPDAEPDVGDGFDGVGEDLVGVLFEVDAAFDFVEEGFPGEGLVVLGGNHEEGLEVGVVGDGAHVVPGVGVAVAPVVDELAGDDLVFDALDQRGGIEVEGIAVGLVEEAFVVFVNLVGVGDVLLPDLFDEGVDVGAAGEGADVAVEGHVAVGDVVALDEEAHGYVVVGGADGAAALFGAEHLEAVDDVMGEGFAAVGEVAAVDGVGLLEAGGFLAVLVGEDVAGEFLEPGIVGVLVLEVLDDVAGTHVLEDVVRVPGAFDDEVTVVLEPFDQRGGVCLDGALEGGFVGEFIAIESLDGHEGEPGMGVLFHNTVDLIP